MAKKKAGPAADGKVIVSKNGPYIVSGGLPLREEIIVSNMLGIAAKWEKGKSYPEKPQYSLCRCGHSRTAPYCDGSHLASGFDGTETASRKTFKEQAETIEGPGLVLEDAKKLCAAARFCDRAGGAWNLTRRSEIPKFKNTAVTEVQDCPSGRLVARDREKGQALEPPFKPSVALVMDAFHDSDGPIWLQGGIPLESSDGFHYETRNRVTLCRCGQSRNKPFCDGAHLPGKFETRE